MNNNVQHGGRQGAKSQPGRGESNMASEHETQPSHAKPMRAAAVQSDNASRFQVASHESGGIAPHHHHHHQSKQPDSILAEQPINHMDPTLEPHNQGSKGYVYRDEDFQPLKSNSTLLARDDVPTPEMHLETLFPEEEEAGRMKPRAQKPSALSSSVTSAQAGQPLGNVSHASPHQKQGDERTDHLERPSVSPELNLGTLSSEPNVGTSKAVDHASQANDPEMQKLRHGPAQRPEYHAPVHTPPPQQATIEHASAPRQQPKSQTTASAPLKKKTWYGVEVPAKQKTSSPKAKAGSKHPLSLGFGFKEIRKVGKAGQVHSSGPSTPVSSSENMQAARVKVPLQNAPLHEDLSKPQQHASSQPANQKPTQTATGSQTHQVLGQPYEELTRVDAAPKQAAESDGSGVHPASYHVPLQNQGHSSTFGINDSTSNASRNVRGDQAFVEPSSQRATHAQGSTVAAAENAFQAGLGGIRSLVDAAMHVPAMVAHALLPEDDEQHQTTTAHSHDHTTLGARSMKRGHSKAVMLKRPRHVDLTLYPEEDPSYPRGDVAFHENPPRPSAASLTSIQEGERAGPKPFHALSGGLFKQPGHATSQAMHSASSNSTADARSEHAYNHTKAAALKRPARDVMLFEEEDGSYPRDNSHRQHENPDHPPHLVEDVHEVQLDAAHLHPHHDLHPTMGESAAAAIASGVEGMRAMLSGINLHYISDSLLAPEGRSHQGDQQQHSHERRHSNAAAGAGLGLLGHSSQSTQQRNAHDKDEAYVHRGDAYFGQHGDHLAGHTHAEASTKPTSSPSSTSKVPLETGHRGDAYYGQHGDMPDIGSSVRAMSKESSMNTFPLESGHRGDAYFGRKQEKTTLTPPEPSQNIN
ncbi:hypothetical protein BGZ70_002978 [Mortierella alpina]|uniref:Uncharacterized protein n=1 Tax=Mortierella alpina TaxID=64518 RepID=A0A9P6LWR9_MORAP|nr:hypothetical protein BGZ70_002978 [Mortierella alpina]